MNGRDFVDMTNNWTEIEYNINKERSLELERKLEISPSVFVENYSNKYHSDIAIAMRKYIDVEKTCDKIRSDCINAVAHRHKVIFKPDVPILDLKPGKFYISYKYDNKLYTAMNLSFPTFLNLYEDLTSVTGKTFNGKQYKGVNFNTGYRTSKCTIDVLYDGYHIYKATGCTVAALRLHHISGWGYNDKEGKAIIDEVNERYDKILADAKAYYEELLCEKV